MQASPDFSTATVISRYPLAGIVDWLARVVMKDGSTKELIPSGFLPWNVDRFATRVCDALGVPFEKRLNDPPVSGPAGVDHVLGAVAAKVADRED